MIRWYDLDSNKIKIASLFDKGINDLPTGPLPPNIIHLNQTTNNVHIPVDDTATTVDDFFFYITPFDNLLTKNVSVKCKSPTSRFQLKEDKFNGCASLHDVTQKSTASKVFSSHRTTQNKIHSSFIISINDTSVFTKENILEIFDDLCKCKVTTFNILFAIEDKLSSKDLWCNHAEHNIFNPNPLTNPNSLSVDYLTIRAITALCTTLNTSKTASPHDILQMYINTLGSTKITPIKQALGNFTCHKLCCLDNWFKWCDAECKQLDQFLKLGTCSTPTPVPKAPNIPTYGSINDAYTDWYKWKYNTPIDRSLLVLPVQHALHGYSESGHLWEENVNRIFTSPELNFKTTVHNNCIYQTTFEGKFSS
eukprot:jgi/Psemu1/5969/gm1.5969_g